MGKPRLKQADGFAFKNLSGGRLPLKMPASMETVERHKEDVFDDIECHTDGCGNVCDFGFGLSYERSDRPYERGEREPI